MKRLLGALLLTCCWTLAGHAEQPRVILIHLDDTIQPVSAGYMDRGLDAAAAQHADAVLIEINTPGGLLESMPSGSGRCGSHVSGQQRRGRTPGG